MVELDADRAEYSSQVVNGNLRAMIEYDIDDRTKNISQQSHGAEKHVMSAYHKNPG
jgi:hypothetical protein